jgi:hypothetical protein
VVEKVIEEVGRYKSWVGSEGSQITCLFCCKLKRWIKKIPSPFKFNHAWIQEESFINLVEKNWKKFEGNSGSSTMFQFSNNLIRVKNW